MSNVSIHGIDIATYPVKDPQRAIAFYRDVLGMQPTWQAEQGAEFTLADGTTFGLWKPENGDWQPGGGIMFAVDDVAAAVDVYRQRGAKIDEQIEETPMCFMAFGEDSEGNHFILHHRKPHGH
jgi:predicted enzyme related to lactoylglutathione lyase